MKFADKLNEFGRRFWMVAIVILFIIPATTFMGGCASDPLPVSVVIVQPNGEHQPAQVIYRDGE